MNNDIWRQGAISLLPGGSNFPSGTQTTPGAPGALKYADLTKPSAQGYSPTGSPSASGGQAGPSASQVAAQQQASQIAGLKEEITARRQRANSIFEALTGAVSALAKEKRGQLEQGFAQEQENAGEEFGQQSNLIASRYRGRGLGDSSYKQYALDDAGEAYADTVEGLGQQRQSGLSQVGADSESALARIRADKGSVNSINLDEIGRREDGSYDPNALIELRNSIDERIREAQVQQSQFNTSSGFRGQLDKIAPYQGTVDTLRNALSQLASSAAPKQVKDRIAQSIIGNYAPTDSQVWTDFYNKEEQKTLAPVSA